MELAVGNWDWLVVDVVGVDVGGGGHGDEIVLDAPAKAVEKNQCSAKY